MYCYPLLLMASVFEGLAHSQNGGWGHSFQSEERGPQKRLPTIVEYSNAMSSV